MGGDNWDDLKSDQYGFVCFTHNYNLVDHCKKCEIQTPGNPTMKYTVDNHACFLHFLSINSALLNQNRKKDLPKKNQQQQKTLYMEKKCNL